VSDSGLYVNGVQVTGTVSTSALSSAKVGDSFDGFLFDVYFIDGTALTPSSFAEEDGTTGQWKPKAYSGSYGDNGFHLDFEDDTDIGNDVSGEGNNFTATNLAASDVVNDTPTDNYCVLNALDKGTVVTLSEGNTVLSNPATSSGWRSVRGTIGVTSGKYYFEASGSYAASTRGHFGIDVNQGVDVDGYNSKTGAIIFGLYDGNLYEDGVTDTGHTRERSGTHNVGVAFDVDAGKVWFRIDGSSTWETNSAGSASGDPATASSIGTATFTAGSLIHPLTSTYGQTATLRFGQSSDWSYEPPTDFLALSTANLPTPTIAKPAEHFDTLTYAGSGAKTFDNGTTSMQPDWVWVKARGNAYDHELTDSVRGVTKALSSNDDGTESTDSTGLTAFGSDGFTVGAGTNYSTSAMVAWSWKAGTSFTAESGVSDSGSKNVDAGFSIATWTGDDDDFSGSSQTITHGLGVVPEMIIAKGRTDSSQLGSNWFVYHKDLDSEYYLILNSTAGQETAYLDVIDNIGTTSADFGTDSTYIHFNYGGEAGYFAADTYVAYFFASKAGYSKIGSFSSSSTAFIYTGFRPSFILTKRAHDASNWLMFDDQREGYNVDNDALYANDSGAETTTDHIDILSNGFKIRTSNSDLNTSTVIYYAVGQSLKYANAR
jgi:hypothetical protein